MRLGASAVLGTWHQVSRPPVDAPMESQVAWITSDYNSNTAPHTSKCSRSSPSTSRKPRPESNMALLWLRYASPIALITLVTLMTPSLSLAARIPMSLCAPGQPLSLSHPACNASVPGTPRSALLRRSHRILKPPPQRQPPSHARRLGGPL